MSYEQYIDAAPRNSSWVEGSPEQAQAAIDQAKPGDQVGVWYTTKRESRSSLVTSGRVVYVVDDGIVFDADRGTRLWLIEPDGDLRTYQIKQFVGWAHMVTVAPQEDEEEP